MPTPRAGASTPRTGVAARPERTPASPRGLQSSSRTQSSPAIAPGSPRTRLASTTPTGNSRKTSAMASPRSPVPGRVPMSPRGPLHSSSSNLQSSVRSRNAAASPVPTSGNDSGESSILSASGSLPRLASLPSLPPEARGRNLPRLQSIGSPRLKDADELTLSQRFDVGLLQSQEPEPLDIDSDVESVVSSGGSSCDLEEVKIVVPTEKDGRPEEHLLCTSHQLQHLSGAEQAAAATLAAELQQEDRQLRKVSEKLLGYKRRIDSTSAGLSECREFFEEEDDLSPEMIAAARRAIDSISVKAWAEIKSYANPPEIVRKVLGASLLFLLNTQTDDWVTIRYRVNSEEFIDELKSFRSEEIKESSIEVLEKKYLSDGKFSVAAAKRASRAAPSLMRWVHAHYEHANTMRMATRKLEANQHERLLRRYNIRISFLEQEAADQSGRLRTMLRRYRQLTAPVAQLPRKPPTPPPTPPPATQEDHAVDDMEAGLTSGTGDPTDSRVDGISHSGPPAGDAHGNQQTAKPDAECVETSSSTPTEAPPRSASGDAPIGGKPNTGPQVATPGDSSGVPKKQLGSIGVSEVTVESCGSPDTGRVASARTHATSEKAAESRPSPRGTPTSNEHAKPIPSGRSDRPTANDHANQSSDTKNQRGPAGGVKEVGEPSRPTVPPISLWPSSVSAKSKSADRVAERAHQTHGGGDRDLPFVSVTTESNAESSPVPPASLSATVTSASALPSDPAAALKNQKGNAGSSSGAQRQRASQQRDPSLAGRFAMGAGALLQTLLNAGVIRKEKKRRNTSDEDGSS